MELLKSENEKLEERIAKVQSTIETEFAGLSIENKHKNRVFQLYLEEKTQLNSQVSYIKQKEVYLLQQHSSKLLGKFIDLIFQVTLRFCK